MHNHTPPAAFLDDRKMIPFYRENKPIVTWSRGYV
jgi:hypothetical protein